MTVYYVDDGGDGSTESSWATADVSINALDAEYALASGDIVYFGHDHVCQATNSGHLVITGPTSGAPVLFISATQGSDPVAYQASSTNQIDTSEAGYNLTFDGSFALIGMCIKAGGYIFFAADQDEVFSAKDCILRLAANLYVTVNANGGAFRLEDTTIDLTADGTTPRANVIMSLDNIGTVVDLSGLSFVNAGYRTGSVFAITTFSAAMRVSGSDFSGFSNATLCELLAITGSGIAVFNNCLTAATWSPMTSAYPATVGGYALFTNVGPAGDPTYLYYRTAFGDVLSSTAIYRTGGATFESTAAAWLITTQAACTEAIPHKTPWIHAVIDSTGSKTFDVFITNDTADFTDAQVWLEVEYLGTASEAISSVASDARATILTTAAAQTDDVTSTWNGTGPSFTYKQKLSVTATVNVAGLYRARVCVGVASIASSRYFYVDPVVTVS